jgi:hypothetical protein
MLDVTGKNALVLACSDGAGSATYAEFGSKICCEAIVAAVMAAACPEQSLTATDRMAVIEWVAQVRDKLSAEAARLDADLRQLACTLLLAVVDDSSAIFAQIGDGAIVTSDGCGYKPVFWPESGEYPNITNFVTEAGFEQFLMYERRDGRLAELAMFTDGLERLALKFDDRTAFGPFFEPMFRVLRGTVNTTNLSTGLRQFLNSRRVNDRTDDDKTLILATRMGALDGSGSAC